MQKQAVELPTLLNDLERDPAATAKRFGHYAIDGGPPSFLVKGSGRVVSVDTLSLVSTAGIAFGSQKKPDALIQVGPVLSGSDIRDALPFINFNQFVNQVQYGEVAISINARVTDKVLIQLDTDEAEGQARRLHGRVHGTRPERSVDIHTAYGHAGHARGAQVSLPRPEIDVVVRAESVSKVFASTVALNHVDFNVYRGKVNALVGENGAGKSTLMGVLAGVHEPTQGRILIDGEEVELDSPRAAGAHGIGLIHQELLLFPDLSVAENIFMGNELTSAAGVRLREQERQAALLLARLGERIEPRAVVADLPVGQQQMVAICKALSQDVRVLIMDEPTSALSAREVESLLEVIRGLVAEGVSVVYISHRLEEILEIADFVTVLRDGRLVAEAATAEIDLHWIVEQMIGRDPEELFPYEPRTVGAPLLEVQDLTLGRPGGGFWLDRVSFSVAAGEIVGVYGLMGAGRTELLQSLIGEQRDAVGRILLDGAPIDGEGIGARIARGLFLVPEDRQREGLVQALSVKQNVSLASLDELGSAVSLSLRGEARAVGRVVEDLGVKVAGIDAPVTALSGGNQQKVVVAKALMTDPKVLLMDDPMRGVDVGAKTELYRIMKRLASTGVAILFTSSDLLEVLGMADRILVMARGRLTRELSRGEATSAALVEASNPHVVGAVAS